MPPVTRELLDQLPLPIAQLVVRARNAKDSKDRHDLAYFAWEASVRLAVAAAPPVDVSTLRVPSVGRWCAALEPPPTVSDSESLRRLHVLLTEEGHGRARRPARLSPRQLLDALPAYRNRVVGHGAVRSAGFYPPAAALLLDGLADAWRHGWFLPPGARVVFVESVEVGPDGQRRGRVFELMGLASMQCDPLAAEALSADVLPGRLYLKQGPAWTCLHPWLAHHEIDVRETVLFFNGLQRQAEVLDFVSGKVLRGAALREALPELADDLRGLFAHGAPVAAEQEQSDDPHRVGDYRLLGKLGEGGMGVVYLAVQESLDRRVALKVLPPGLAHDEVALARFRREILALSRCEHPNVIKVFDSGTWRGTPFYVMEYVEGADLAEVAGALSDSADFSAAVTTAARARRAKRKELFPDLPDVERPSVPTAAPRRRDRFRDLARLFADAARGLHHLHALGIVHRDVKPANLMVTTEDHRVVVMDLGLASVTDATRSLTRETSSVIGTLRYMAPEQLLVQRRAVDRRADVYSLGATAYELVADRPFFDGDSEARLMQQVLREEPVPVARANPGVPADLATVIGKAVAKNAQDRYDTALDLAEDLEAFLRGRPISARRPTLAYVARLWVRRHRALVAVTMAAFLIVVATFAYSFVEVRRQRDEAEARARQARAYYLAWHGLQEADRSPHSSAHLALAAVRADDSAATRAALRRALGRIQETAVWRGHAPGALAADVSSDGRWVVTGSADGTVRLWSTDGAHRPRLLPGDGQPVHLVELGPDAATVAVASAGGTVSIRRAHGDGRGDAQLAHEAEVTALAFDAAGEHLVTRSGDRRVHVWRVRDGEPLMTLDPEQPGRSVVFSPDGRQVVAAANGGAVTVWTWERGPDATRLLLHDETVYSAAFGPNGKRVLTACADGAVRSWDLESAREPLVVTRHPDRVYLATFSADGRSIVTASRDATARIVRADGTGTPVVLDHAAPVVLAAFSGDGGRVVTATRDGDVRISSADGKGRRRALPMTGATVRAIAFADGGEGVLTATDDGTARLWPVAPPEASLLVGRGEAPLVAAGGNAEATLVAGAAEDGSVRVWSADGSGKVVQYRAGGGPLVALAFSPDGKQLLVVPEDAPPRSYRVGDPDSAHDVAGLDGPVTAAAYSPRDGRLVVALPGDPPRIWLIRPGKEQPLESELAGHEERVRSLEFSPDGARVLSASDDGTVRLWSLSESGVGKVLHEGPQGVVSARFDADSRRVVAVDDAGTVHVIDVETSTEGFTIRPLDLAATDAAFSPDGRWIVIAGDDGAASVWSIDERAEEWVLKGHGLAITAAWFDPGGTRIFTASRDGTVRLWDFPDVVQLAERRLARLDALTDRDCERFGDFLPEETCEAARRYWARLRTAPKDE